MSSTCDHYSPEYAVALLDELERYGFTDSAFRTIHHFGPKATIQSYYDYCKEKVTNFYEDGTNERVCRRLEVIVKAFKAAQFGVPAKLGILDALAAAARIEIPILD